MALVVAMGGTRQWSIDQSRSSRESIPPATYLSSSYYKIWIEGLSRLIVERGMVTREELAEGKARAAPMKPPVLAAASVAAALGKSVSSEHAAATPARFKAGDRVRTKNIHPKTHTRLPRYCRGKPGTIVKVHGSHSFPDASALGHQEGHWLYCVRFDAHDLWGPDTTASAVYVDLWEPYLE